MHVESHAGSKKNAGLLRAYSLSFMALIGLTSERADFLDGISIVMPNPEKEGPEPTEEDDKKPAIEDLLLRENPPEGVKFKSGGMFASFAKLRSTLREYDGEIAEHTATIRDTGKKLYRNLGKDADKAMLQACIARGYKPPEVKAPQKGA